METRRFPDSGTKHSPDEAVIYVVVGPNESRMYAIGCQGQSGLCPKRRDAGCGGPEHV
jgi:hypothetical protein